MTERYYSPAEDGSYVTQSGFEDLGHEEQTEYMVHWFYGLFCDPAEETPYNGREGGYLYVWGGPYEAGDELYREFGKFAAEEAINAAIAEVEVDGIYEWAPASNHPDQIVARDDALAEAEWLDQALSDDPYGVFTETYRQLSEFIEEQGSDDGGSLINRMVFAQQVSALEAYLGDTLLRYVTDRPKSMGPLLTGDKNLRAQRVPLAEIVGNPDIVLEKVTTYLRSILYHDLPNVDFLYSKVTGVRILRDKDDNTKLLQAIRYRHDCVHRNGMDKDGNRLTVFTKKYVQEIAIMMRNLVDDIDAKISDF